MSRAPLLQTFPASGFLERVQSAVFGEVVGQTEATYYRICTTLMATTVFEYIWAIPFFFLGQHSGQHSVSLVVKMVYYAGLVVGITVALSFEYVLYKTVWGDRDVFQGEISTICGMKTGVSRWRWQFLNFVPNYIAVVSSSYSAGAVYWANNEDPQLKDLWVWLFLVVLLIGSACIHSFLVGYWTCKVKGLPLPSMEKEAMHGLMAEACDAGNLQFIGICFRKNAGDSDQRSRLATCVLVKMPLAFVKTLAVASVWDEVHRIGDDELKTAYHSLALAWVLNIYGIMQLLPTFFRMLCKRPLCYCVPLVLLVLGLLFVLGSALSFYELLSSDLPTPR